MKINTQSVNFKIDASLLSFIQKRMDKLDLFFDKIIKVDVYLKAENTPGKENKVFEAVLFIPGDSFVVKKKCKSFKQGVDTVVHILERQLKKRKDKRRKQTI
ncbi:MAG: ribosomal subunit interface protein [Formosa sp.]|jgi:putative sigma-54 modulation protein|nr:ribosomal subunit interface protein [Formosa sp.]|tara:strand:- start:141 stop:446 length:306 start_codon:yes stop_codon:yes gene_type:complete